MSADVNSNPVHILLATTGSVASIKLPFIVTGLSLYSGIEMQVVATPHSLHFYEETSVSTFEGEPVKIWKDEDEWNGWHKISDSILHIETSLLRATDPKEVPVILFPAMNTLMYEHPLTQKQLDILQREVGYEVSGPISKTLACGDTGLGAMTEWEDIVKMIVERFQLKLKTLE